MKVRYYNVNGDEIKSNVDPSYAWRNNPKEDKPQDFVIIKQLEIDNVVTDPYGNPQEIHKLSDPVEEVYCGWEWNDGTWYCLIRLIVKKGEILKDRRPTWWKFFEDFNKNRPRFL